MLCVMMCVMVCVMLCVMLVCDVGVCGGVELLILCCLGVLITDERTNERTFVVVESLSRLKSYGVVGGGWWVHLDYSVSPWPQFGQKPNVKGQGSRPGQGA